MDEFRIWLEDTGLPSMQAAITRLDEEISADVQGSAVGV
jgi:hypothetical protein